jgi:hypothetical protein
MWSLLLLVHLIGLSLGVGAASVKFALLLQAYKDPTFGQTYLKVFRPITRFIILGLILLTLSGIGWLLLGYHLTSALSTKIALVVSLWVLGPYMDNFVEPKFIQLMPGPGKAPSAAFLSIRRRYVALETLATGLMYAVLLMGWRL